MSTILGSSSIISLLVSYGYRYEMINRMKTVRNGFCKKIVKCYIDNNNYNITRDEMIILNKYMKNSFGSLGKQTTIIIIIIIIMMFAKF